MQQLLLSYIKTLCRVEGEAVCHGLIPCPPGLVTVSFDPEASVYNGMHTDSWDSPPGYDRNLSPNRISINVGTEDRALLFVNLTVDQMARDMHQAGYGSVDQPLGTAFGQQFLRTFPDYPIVRLRVRPGEAYIAPTENVMHDGSTEGGHDTSWHITLRGRISLI
jgi:hypothetical protein